MGDGRLYTVSPAVAGFRRCLNNSPCAPRVTFSYMATWVDFGNPASPVFSAHRQLDAQGLVSEIVS